MMTNDNDAFRDDEEFLQAYRADIIRQCLMPERWRSGVHGDFATVAEAEAFADKLVAKLREIMRRKDHGT